MTTLRRILKESSTKNSPIHSPSSLENPTMAAPSNRRDDLDLLAVGSSSGCSPNSHVSRPTGRDSHNGEETPEKRHRNVQRQYSESSYDGEESEGTDSVTRGFRDKNDYICAVCEKEGDLLLCDGPCLSAFHIECLGLKDLPKDEQWFCNDCKQDSHVCFLCKERGSSLLDREDSTVQEVQNLRKCCAISCGKFYHLDCIKQHQLTRLSGKNQFICPLHTCNGCFSTGSSASRGVSMRCTRCPTSFHSKCLPKTGITKIMSRRIICCKGKQRSFIKKEHCSLPADKSTTTGTQLDQDLSKIKDETQQKKAPNKTQSEIESSLAPVSRDIVAVLPRESFLIKENAPSAGSREDPPKYDNGGQEDSRRNTSDEDMTGEGKQQQPNENQNQPSKEESGEDGGEGEGDRGTGDRRNEGNGEEEDGEGGEEMEEGEEDDDGEDDSDEKGKKGVHSENDDMEDKKDGKKNKKLSKKEKKKRKKKKKKRDKLKVGGGSAEKPKKEKHGDVDPTNAVEQVKAEQIKAEKVTTEQISSTESLVMQSTVAVEKKISNVDVDSVTTSNSMMSTPPSQDSPLGNNAKANRGGRAAAVAANTKLMTSKGKKKSKQPKWKQSQAAAQSQPNEEHVVLNSPIATPNEVQWVQCDQCKKWRTLAPNIPLRTLPEKWFCSMNTWNLPFSVCEAPEEELRLSPEKNPSRANVDNKSTGIVVVHDSGPVPRGASSLPALDLTVINSTTSEKVAPVLNSTKSVRATQQSPSLKKVGLAAAAGGTPTSGSGTPTMKEKGSRKRKLKEKRWVQCDSAQCGKWRSVPHSFDMRSLPAKWYCSYNTWHPHLASCSIPNPPEDDGAAASVSSAGKKPSSSGRPAKQQRHVGRPSKKPKSNDTEQSVHAKVHTPNSANSHLNSSDSKSKVAKTKNGSHTDLDHAGRKSGSSSQHKKSKEKKTENCLWVQCEQCEKWRKVPSYVSSSNLPEKWYCTMNKWDPLRADCSVEQEDDQEASEPGSPLSSVVYRKDRGKLCYRELLFGSNGLLRKAYTEEMNVIRMSDGTVFYRDDQYRDSSMYSSPKKRKSKSSSTDSRSMKSNGTESTKENGFRHNRKSVHHTIQLAAISPVKKELQDERSSNGQKNAMISRSRSTLRELVLEKLSHQSYSLMELVVSLHCEYDYKRRETGELVDFFSYEMIRKTVEKLVTGGDVEKCVKPRTKTGGTDSSTTAEQCSPHKHKRRKANELADGSLSHGPGNIETDSEPVYRRCRRKPLKTSKPWKRHQNFDLRVDWKAP